MNFFTGLRPTAIADILMASPNRNPSCMGLIRPAGWRNYPWNRVLIRMPPSVIRCRFRSSLKWNRKHFVGSSHHQPTNTQSRRALNPICPYYVAWDRVFIGFRGMISVAKSHTLRSACGRVFSCCPDPVASASSSDIGQILATYSFTDYLQRFLLLSAIMFTQLCAVPFRS